MIALLLTLCALAGSACADCDACVAGWCHSRNTLIEGFHVTDQLAIDHTHNLLYIQLNSNLNSAFFLDDFKIKLIQLLNSSGMAVDQETQDLYIADYNRNIYKFKYGSNTSELYIVNTHTTDVELLFFKNVLYYTSRRTKEHGIQYIKDSGYYYSPVLHELNLTITDFVVKKDEIIYYVANNKVYVLRNGVYKLVSDKHHFLSTDKLGDVYLGDNKVRAIYKLNEADELEEYAAYKTGSVDRFVFDRDNNIVYHDTANGNVFTWKKELTKCKIHAPHTYYSIDELSTVLEINEEAQ